MQGLGLRYILELLKGQCQTDDCLVCPDRGSSRVWEASAWPTPGQLHMSLKWARLKSQEQDGRLVHWGEPGERSRELCKGCYKYYWDNEAREPRTVPGAWWAPNERHIHLPMSPSICTSPFQHRVSQECEREHGLASLHVLVWPRTLYCCSATNTIPPLPSG